MKKPILIWDIDGTLSDSSGAGIDALSRTIEEHFDNAKNPTLDLAGATDGGIYRIMCERYDKAFSKLGLATFLKSYIPKLEENLTSGKFPGTIYPTVKDTLAYFDEEGYTQGLLTGNIEQGAYLKNKAQGIEEYFAFGAYSDDHHNRNELGFFAAERASEHLNDCITPEDLLIIGDTIKDIACARACGAKVAAITTGHANKDELADADWVINQAEELIDIIAEF